MENPTYQKMSENDFVQLLTEKANMLKNHLKDTQSSLVMCANIGPNITIFRLYNTLEEDYLKISMYYNKLRKPWRTTIPIMATIKLFSADVFIPIVP